MLFRMAGACFDSGTHGTSDQDSRYVEEADQVVVSSSL